MPDRSGGAQIERLENKNRAFRLCDSLLRSWYSSEGAQSVEQRQQVVDGSTLSVRVIPDNYGEKPAGFVVREELSRAIMLLVLVFLSSSRIKILRSSLSISLALPLALTVSLHR